MKDEFIYKCKFCGREKKSYSEWLQPPCIKGRKNHKWVFVFIANKTGGKN